MNPAVFSYEPIFASQIDRSEWNYDNVRYFKPNYANIQQFDIIEFISEFKLKSVFIPEIEYKYLTNIIPIFNQLQIKTFTIPNIEILNLSNIHQLKYFDKILCNNIFTQSLLTSFKLKTELLQFNTPITSCTTLSNNSFYCIGGINAITRKQIPAIIKVFELLKTPLHVYIQGKEIPTSSHKNIIILVKALSYSEIINIHKKHSHFIHLGSQEGLGIDFYTATNTNSQVITLDTFPNNEIITKSIFLIKSSKENIKTNKDSIICADKVNKRDLYDKIKNILKLKPQQIQPIKNLFYAKLKHLTKIK